MATPEEWTSRTNQVLRDGPWLRPEGVDLVDVEVSVVEPETEEAGPQRPVNKPPVPVLIPTGPLLPEWWIGELRDYDSESFDALSYHALRIDEGTMAPFQQHPEASITPQELPGQRTRGTFERSALDPSQRDRLVNPQELLGSFLRLTDAEPQKYAEFARQYGALRICRLHAVPHRYCAKTATNGACWPLRPEPLLYWRFCAEFVTAVLRVAHTLEDDERSAVADRDWALLTGQPPADVAQRKPPLKDHEAARWHPQGDLAAGVERWLRYGDVRLRLRWRPSAEPELEESGVGLFGALAKRLAYGVVGAERRVLCDGDMCDKAVVIPPQKPRPGNRVFCEKCKDAGVPKKLANREYRARNRRLVAIVEEELNGPPPEPSEAEMDTFWQEVHELWEREGHPPRSAEKLKEDYARESA